MKISSVNHTYLSKQDIFRSFVQHYYRNEIQRVMIIDEEFKLNLKKLFGYEDLKNKDLNIEKKLANIFEFLNFVNAMISWKMLEN